MEHEKKLKFFFVAIILVVVLLTIFGIMINVISNRHIAQKIAEDHDTLKGAYAEYREINSMADNVNMAASMPWSVDVQSQIDGTVTHVLVKHGDIVKAGDILCYVENKNLEISVAGAEADISEARINLRNLELNVNRNTQLLAQEAVSQAEYDTSVAQRDAMQDHIASLETKKAGLMEQQNKLVVRAPQDGVVIRIYTKEGTYLSPGRAILLLGKTDNLQVRFGLSLEQAQRLLHHGAQELTMEIPDELLSYRIYPLDKEYVKEQAHNVFFIKNLRLTPDLDSGASSYTLYGEVENGGQYLEPTTYNKVKLYSSATHKVLSVPREAVKKAEDNQGDYCVYLLDDNNRVMIRQVVCGIKNENYVEILDGLQQGDRVLLTTRSFIQEGEQVKLSMED